MTRRLILIACALPLAACNNSPQVNEKNASVAEVAKAVRDSGASDSFVRPGKWQSKVTIEEFDVPGVPPEMQQRMKSSMAQFQGRGFETCLTPEEVKRPKEDFFTGKNERCRYDHFTMGRGRIDALMRCGSPDGSTQVTEMAGSYSPDTYAMHMAMHQEGGEKSSAGMSMKMRVDAQRTGECDAKSKEG